MTALRKQVEAVRADHERGCAVCYYASDGPCSIAVLLDRIDVLEAMRTIDIKHVIPREVNDG